MIPPPPRSTLFPYTTLFRSYALTGLLGRVPKVGRFLRRFIPVADYRDRMDERQQLGEDDLFEWARDRKSTRLNSSHGYISYAVFCLKKKTNKRGDRTTSNRL